MGGVIVHALRDYVLAMSSFYTVFFSLGLAMTIPWDSAGAWRLFFWSFCLYAEGVVDGVGVEVEVVVVVVR